MTNSRTPTFRPLRHRVGGTNRLEKTQLSLRLLHTQGIFRAREKSRITRVKSPAINKFNLLNLHQSCVPHILRRRGARYIRTRRTSRVSRHDDLPKTRLTRDFSTSRELQSRLAG